MKQLFLIRHAKSDWTDDCKDFDRVINDCGFNDAQLIGKYLHDHKQQFDRVYCSTASRARLTLEQLNATLNLLKTSIQYEQSLYLASLVHLVSFIENVSDEFQYVALIGHNPGITDLCNFLSGDQLDNLPTCAVYTIDFHVDEWRAVGFKSGNKSNLITPRMLKDK